MPATTYAKLLRALEKKTPGGTFFLYGDEEYLREEAVDRVVGAHLDEGTRDFNLDQLRGAEVSAEDLASLLATPPMMAEWRVIVVRDAQGLSIKAREVVEGAAQSPPSGLVLVLSASIPSSSKAKFYSTLKKLAVSVEFATVDPHDLPGWLMERAEEDHGVELEVEAARALVSAIGSQVGVLVSEMEKLAAYVQDRRRITLEDVRAVGGAIPRVDRWAWFDLVGERRFGEALRQLPLLLEAKETGVGLVIGMATQLLRVGLVCAGGTAALERELKPYQRWMARRVAPQARHWTSAEVDAALEELLRTDRLLKTTALSDRQALEELLLRLHGNAAAGRTAA